MIDFIRRFALRSICIFLLLSFIFSSVYAVNQSYEEQRQRDYSNRLDLRKAQEQIYSEDFRQNRIETLTDKQTINDTKLLNSKDLKTQNYKEYLVSDRDQLKETSFESRNFLDNVFLTLGLKGDWNKPAIKDSGDIVKVDMPLDWLPTDKNLVLNLDIFSFLITANNRWDNCAKVSAPDIADAIDSEKYKIIEVSGINSTGLSFENLQKISSNLNLKDNEVLIIGHSAGTDAVIRSMPFIKRDKKDVYFLLLSPRMSSSSQAKYMKDSKVLADNVLTVNSYRDFPHWPTGLKSVLKLASDSWHGYDNNRDAGSHVFIWDDNSIKEKDRQKRNLLDPGGHSSMINGLYDDRKFQVAINGGEQIYKPEGVTMINIINTWLEDSRNKK